VVSCGTVPGDGLVERSLNPQVLVVRLINPHAKLFVGDY